LFIVLRPESDDVAVSRIPVKTLAAVRAPGAKDPIENIDAIPPAPNKAETPVETTPDKAPNATACVNAS
jgi:hypothetical protein